MIEGRRACDWDRWLVDQPGSRRRLLERVPDSARSKRQLSGSATTRRTARSALPLGGRQWDETAHRRTAPPARLWTPERWGLSAAHAGVNSCARSQQGVPDSARDVDVEHFGAPCPWMTGLAGPRAGDDDGLSHTHADHHGPHRCQNHRVPAFPAAFRRAVTVVALSVLFAANRNFNARAHDGPAGTVRFPVAAHPDSPHYGRHRGWKRLQMANCFWLPPAGFRNPRLSPALSSVEVQVGSTREPVQRRGGCRGVAGGSWPAAAVTALGPESPRTGHSSLAAGVSGGREGLRPSHRLHSWTSFPGPRPWWWMAVNSTGSGPGERLPSWYRC